MEELLIFITGITPLDTFTRIFVLILFISLLRWIIDGIRGY